VNASVLTGIVPSILYKKFGPKKSILIGGGLLTICHIISALILGADLGKTIAGFLLFFVAIVGG
jgi:hypothetical protein